jgi:hypothetical protein
VDPKLKKKMVMDMNPAEMKKRREQDKSYGITEVRFQDINFKYHWPFIVTDLARYLTGREDCF